MSLVTVGKITYMYISKQPCSLLICQVFFFALADFPVMMLVRSTLRKKACVLGWDLTLRNGPNPLDPNSFLLTEQSSHISLMCWSKILVLTDTLGFHGVMVSTLDFESSDPSSNLGGTLNTWLRGATVARLTPDQKAACSNHVGVNNIFEFSFLDQKEFASNEDWTHDLWFTRPTLCHWAIEALMETDVKRTQFYLTAFTVSRCDLHHIDWLVSTYYKWLNGLGVWFSLWVREVPGSNPGWAHKFFTKTISETQLFFTKSS